MTKNILGYSFEGPFQKDSNAIRNQLGVYVVYDNAGTKVVDVGQSETLSDRLSDHEREDCWKRNDWSSNVANIYVRYISSQVERGRIEQEIRNHYGPPCGER